MAPHPPIPARPAPAAPETVRADRRLSALAAALPASVPFVGPEALERAAGRPFTARLGANESLFGPSPLAVAAMAEAALEGWKYGDPEGHDLRIALAEHHGVAPANLVLGEGIDGLLGYLVRLYAGPGDAVVTSHGAYPTFNYHVAGFGAALHAVPYRDDREDTEALAEAAHSTGAKLVYLANPDNPMGSWQAPGVISALLDALPGTCLLILDEAYAEFAPAGAIPPLDVADTRLVRLRTFSKAYGLAGLRVGYALGHPSVIAGFERVRAHFGVGRVAQAGALAALGDTAHLARVCRAVEEARGRIAEIAGAHGLQALPSAANFVTIDCRGDGAFARRLLEALGRRGIFLRMPFTPPEDRCIRVTCAPEADLARFEAALGPALEEVRAAIDEAPARPA